MMLRFILTYENILDIMNSKIFDENSKNFQLLKEYESFIQKNCQNIPELKEIPKKKMVLIGQQILRNFIVIQLNVVTLVCDKSHEELNIRWPIIDEHYIQDFKEMKKNQKDLYNCLDEENEEGDSLNIFDDPIFDSD